MVVDGDILAGVLVPIHHRWYFLHRYPRAVRLATYAEPYSPSPSGRGGGEGQAEPGRALAVLDCYT
jgi:hypothetical protein